MRFIIFFILSFAGLSSAWAESDVGAYVFTQGLSASLTITNKENQELKLNTDAPSFVGMGLSYNGIGGAYSQTSNSEDERKKRSSVRGFKWTIPWGRFLFEYYNSSFNGAAVGNSDSPVFRSDISAFAQGLVVSWSYDKSLDFSSIFGLEKNLSQGAKQGKSVVYYTSSIAEARWEGSTSFWQNPSGPTDPVAFNDLRRLNLNVGVGRTYVKYFEYLRLSAMGDFGLYAGELTLKYQDSQRTKLTNQELGAGLTVAFSLASDWGFRDLGKKNKTYFNYGLNALGRFSFSSADGYSISNGVSAFELYLGAIW